MARPLETTPAAGGFRTPAEWEPHAGCWMAWPERPDNWPLGAAPAREAFATVARAIAAAEPVTMAISDGQFGRARAPRRRRASKPPRARSRGTPATDSRPATSTSTSPTRASSTRCSTRPTTRRRARSSPPPFPTREAVGVPAREILLGGGNVHCITQQVPSSIPRPPGGTVSSQ